MDAFDLPAGNEFDCFVAGFFFSHILLAQRPVFLHGIAQALQAGARIALFDNRFVAGRNSPISTQDESGDTHQ